MSMELPPTKHYYDQHTLKISSGPLGASEIEKSLRVTLDTLIENWNSFEVKNSEKYLQELQGCNFKINVVSTVAGPNKPAKMYGFCYVWLSSTAFYYILCGKNPDGSMAVRKIVDPEWKSGGDIGFDPESYNIKVSGPAQDKFLSKGYSLKSWADITQFEEEVEDMFIPRMIEIPEPLIQMAPIEYTKDQRNSVIAANLTSGKSIDNVPYHHTFKVEPAFILKNTNPNISQNTLKSIKVPLWVTKEMLENLFRMFGTDPKIYQVPITTNGRREIIKTTYPIVRLTQQTINNGQTVQNAFIQFSPDQDYFTDAGIARLIARQVIIKHPRTNDSCLLIFDFWEEVLSKTPQKVVPKAKYGDAPDGNHHIIV